MPRKHQAIISQNPHLNPRSRANLPACSVSTSKHTYIALSAPNASCWGNQGLQGFYAVGVGFVALAN